LLDGFQQGTKIEVQNGDTNELQLEVYLSALIVFVRRALENERIACYRKSKRDRRLDFGPWTDR
jgi:hypothetical protein